MKHKKVLLLASLFSAINLFALEGTVSTGSNFEAEISPQSENKSVGIKAQPMVFKRVGYDAKLVGLELNFKEVGLKLGATLKSKRKDLRLNDWDEDSEKDIKKRSKNHDLMAKLNLVYESPEFYGLKSTTEVKYYVDDLFSSRIKNHDTNTVVDDYNSLYHPSEYIEDDGSKERAGNVIISEKVSGNIKGTNTELDLGIDYKANQLYRFDKDESYLKMNANVKSKLTDNNSLEFNYTYDQDLNLSSKKYKGTSEKLNEYPDFIENKYVDLIKQTASLKSNNKLEKDVDLNLALELETKHLLISESNSPKQVYVSWDKLDPKIKIELVKKLNSYLSAKLNVDNNFKIGLTNYREDVPLKDDVWAAYVPEYTVGLLYNQKLDGELEREYSNDFNFGYNPNITVSPFVTQSKNIKHKVILKDKFSVKHEIIKGIKLSASGSADFEIPVSRGFNENINSNLTAKVGVDAKVDDKTNVTASLEDKFQSKSEQKILNPDDLSNAITFITKVNRKILKDEKQDLNFVSDFNVSSKTSYEYYTENEPKVVAEKEVGSNEKNKFEKPEGFYRGYASPIVSINTISLKNKISYENKLKSNLKLVAEGQVNAEIKTLYLKTKKLANITKVDDDKMIPLLSSYRETNVNVGGKLEFVPSVKIEYSPLDKLSLTAGLKTVLTFERNVVNKIDDENRVDNGQYAEIDKNFKFKSLVPTVSLGLEYKW